MTIQLHGKEYVEVKDRVAAAHAEDSYSMLKEETFSLGGREYVRVFIDVKGKQYIGTAECKYNANPKTPDGMSPFECGETSALGRALGFAGYGVVDSIASADEVVSNEQQESAKGQALHALTAKGSYEKHHGEAPQANGDEPQYPIEIIRLLSQFKELEPAWCKGRSNWDRVLLTKVLELQTLEPFPSLFDEDDINRVELYVESVKQKKAKAVK